MLYQSPRLLHAAALRETLHGMSVRLGHVEGFYVALCPGIRLQGHHQKHLQQADARRSRLRPTLHTGEGMSSSAGVGAFISIYRRMVLKEETAQGRYGRRPSQRIMRQAQQLLSRS